MSVDEGNLQLKVMGGIERYILLTSGNTMVYR